MRTKMINKSFASRLKMLRTGNELTQSQLAKIIGVCSSMIWKWENSYNHPQPDMILKIADFFNVEVDFLLGKDDRINENYFNENFFMLHHKKWHTLTQKEKDNLINFTLNIINEYIKSKENKD